MLEETVPSIWSSISSWFTPTFLFLLLNLVIGIIVVSSSFGSHKPKPPPPQQQAPIEFLQDQHYHHQQLQQQQQQQQQAPLARAPSVLERFKSINLYHFKTEDFNPFHTSTHFQHPPPEESIINTTVTSSSYETNHHQQQQPPPPPLARAPSILERLKSINLYNFKPEDFNPFPSITNTFQQQSEPMITTHSRKQVSNPTQVQKRQQSRGKNPDEFLDHRALDKNKSKSKEKINVDDEFLDSLALSKKNSKTREKINPDDELFSDLRALSKNKSKTSDNNYNNNHPDDEFLDRRVLSKNKSKTSDNNYNNPDDELMDHRVLNKNKSKTSDNNNTNPDDVFLDNRVLNKNKSKTIPPRQRVKEKKLMSAKSDVIGRNFGEEEEEEENEMDYERRRPSTVKDNKSKGADEMHTVGVDEHVDAKADDFINRFKNQLKLQRLDSLMRYKDMLTGGSTK